MSLEEIFFKNRETFRSWLENNHDKSPGIWMVYYKNHLKTQGVSYKEALEEALCFGWIDSIIKRIDDEKYVRKFTPRTNISNWSDVNKKIVLELIAQGRMTEHGLKKIDSYKNEGKVTWKVEDFPEKKNEEFVIPDFIAAELGKNEPALTNFNKLPKSHKRNYIGWITSAKKEETKTRRLAEAVGMLKQVKKLGLK